MNLKREDAVEGRSDEDVSGDTTLADDVEDLLKRGWLSRAGWERARSKSVTDEHRRAQELLDQGTPWW